MFLSAIAKRFSKRERSFSNPGSRIRIIYSGEFADDGTFSVVPTGKVDLYREIQVYAPTVDIDTILQRYSLGDVDALNKVEGFYADISNMPNSFAEMLNTIQRSREFFERMPAEFKEKYGNDFGVFLATTQPSDFFASQPGQEPQEPGGAPEPGVPSSSCF